MSFYTTLSFYRPTPPPPVTGLMLAEFLNDLCGTGLFERGGAEYFSVKFGRSIDQDSLGTFIQVLDPKHPSMSTMRSIEWDINHQNVTLDDAIRLLSNHERTIYRASINLGALRDDVRKCLQTRRPDDGEVNLELWDCSLYLGPVELFDLVGEERFQVGWMDLSFSGNGYLYPWTPRNLTTIAGSLEALEPITELSRRRFPIADDRRCVSRSDIAERQAMAELWPFRDLERDFDWFWGVCESG